MKRNIFYFLIIILGFVGGIGIRVYVHKKEEMALFQAKLKEYLSSAKNFRGLPEKISLVTLKSDTPFVYRLKKEKNYLILYFRLNDCMSCINEMAHIIDTFSNVKNLEVLVVTDHPVIYEIQYFIYQLGFKEIIWDKEHHLIASDIKKTPSYIFIKKNHIKDVGIIAPYKPRDVGAFEEVYGLYAHKLKKRLLK